MEKLTFQEIFMDYIVPSIEGIRKTLPSTSCKRALLIMDGHSTRNNYPLMKFLSSLQIDVIILPAHTSAVTQPLDLCCNAQFKRLIAKKKLQFPLKAKFRTDLFSFLDGLEDAMEEALLRPKVKCGFAKACIALKPTTELLKELRHAPPDFVPPTVTRFSISGEIITEVEFLSRWETHLGVRPSEPLKEVIVQDEEEPEDFESAVIGMNIDPELKETSPLISEREAQEVIDLIRIPYYPFARKAKEDAKLHIAAMLNPVDFEETSDDLLKKKKAHLGWERYEEEENEEFSDSEESKETKRKKMKISSTRKRKRGMSEEDLSEEERGLDDGEGGAEENLYFLRPFLKM
jgi:hypothetical protein